MGEESVFIQLGENSQKEDSSPGKINMKCFRSRFSEEVNNVNKIYTAELQELYHDIFSATNTGTFNLMDALEEISSNQEKSQQVILKLQALIAFSIEKTNYFGWMIKNNAIANSCMASSTMAHLMSLKFYTDWSTLESHIQMLTQDLQLKALSQSADNSLKKTVMIKNECQPNKKENTEALSPSRRCGSFFDLKTLTSSLGHEMFLMKRIVEKIDDNIKDHLVAHRGFHCIKDQSKVRPLENTLAAFEQAWALGMKHAECDVVLTKDNRLMLCHDDTFERLAMFPSRRTFVNKHPKNLEAKEVLTKCFTRSGAGVPFLTHVLDIAAAIGDHKKLVLELKPGGIGAAERLVEILKANQSYFSNISVIMSFDMTLISHLAKLIRKTFPLMNETKLLYLLVKPEEVGKYPQPYNHFPIEDPSKLQEWIGELDGFYVGYSDMLISTYQDIFKNICKRYVMGVYDIEPDCVLAAERLSTVGVAYINTDMPRSLLHGL